MNNFINSLGSLMLMNNGRSRALTAENPRGEKGKGGMAESPLGVGRKGSPCKYLKAGETAVLADISGAGVIQHIWITVENNTSDTNCFVLRDLVLRMYWDGEENPSVEAPLGDFFCLGFGETYQVNSQPIAVNPSRGMNCYFQMPFRKGAKITVESQHPADVECLFYQIDYCEYDESEIPEDAAYFHAKWNREKVTELGKDYTIIDGIKGKGHYVGTFMALSTLQRYWWGEGEVKFYMDGDRDFPTICGTGTEDYFGGAWAYVVQEDGKSVEQTFNSMYAGYPYYSRHDDLKKNDFHNDDCPPMRAFYRWHILDPVRFEKDLRVTVQQIGITHGGTFERQDDVSTVAYWYQVEPHAPFKTLAERKDRHPR